MRLLPFLLLLCSQFPAAEIRRRLLAVDDGTLTLHHVDQNDPSRNWKVPFGGCCIDLQLIGSEVGETGDAYLRGHDLERFAC